MIVPSRVVLVILFIQIADILRRVIMSENTGKNVLTILLGSPRKEGNSEVLADALAEGAGSKGWEVRKVRLAPMNIKGCLDCRRCWTMDKPCIQNDDMCKVYGDIEAASVVAFATPLYYYSWPAQIKPVLDRLLPYAMANAEHKIDGKNAILLAACGDKDGAAFEGLKASFRLAMNFLKWEIAGEICVPDVYVKGDMALKGTKFIEEAKRLGENL